MFAGRSIALLSLWCFASSGCAANVSHPPVAIATAATATVTAGTYRVKPQDTLYGIAFRHHLDYRDLAQWNRLGPDYAISIGQTLLLHAPSAKSSPTPPTRPRQSERARGVVSGVLPAGLRWFWPTHSSTPPRTVPGGGILLFGTVGQDVRAAGAGRVVYVGNGIRGYGNLVILKHGDTVLSAYAHNQVLLVREGQDVTAGQAIGHMGTGPHQVAVLYFEIRLNGKPVDPIRYLPKKQ